MSDWLAILVIILALLIASELSEHSEKLEEIQRELKIQNLRKMLK